jgi:hypothetical protein
MFHRHQHRTAPFAAERETLHDAQRQKQDGRPDADLFVIRQKADGEGCHTHHDQRDEQHRLAADPVTEMAEKRCPDDAGEIGRGEGAEGQKRADERIETRKEDLVEDECRSGGEDEKIVPFDGGADDACDGDPPNANRLFLDGAHECGFPLHEHSPLCCCEGKRGNDEAERPHAEGMR